MEMEMETSPPADDYMPLFCVGQHASKRTIPVTAEVLKQAHEYNYDMLTTPITSPHFHSRVLTLLSAHLSKLQPSLYESKSTLGGTSVEPPAPTIPPLTPTDTPLTPCETISQLLAFASSWIDLASPDPLIANLSQQVLNLETAYAAFCGVGNLIVAGPRLHHGSENDGDGIAQYARAIQEALSIGPYLQIQILLPMIDHPDHDADGEMGSLAPFAREQFMTEADEEPRRKADLFGTWDAWNVIRTVCKYNARLSVALSLPRHLPPISVQSRWYSEPLRLLSIDASTFLKNSKGYPVLSKSHQALISRYMRLKNPPWLLLCDVGPIPGVEDLNGNPVPSADGFLSPSAAADARAGSPSPTPAEAAASQSQRYSHPGKKSKDPTPHLSYIRHLQRNQPPRSTIERFGSGYQDYLQAPLQPLTDNLESITYEVFEKDPVKYDWYERAIARALSDWAQQGKATSRPDGKVVVAVVGAGRGPLVTRALKASASTGVEIDMWAVEKNPNAYVLLQRHNLQDWNSQVTVVKSDMRSWKGPTMTTSVLEGGAAPPSERATTSTTTHTTVDILISELLGSFADNELSPECLDGAQHVVHPTHGISIPASYTAHLTPISAPKLHADISARIPVDAAAPETPYVVMLHAIDFLSTLPMPSSAAARESMSMANTTTCTSSNPPNTTATPVIQTAWEFSHPNPHAPNIEDPPDNSHNTRYARLRFRCADRGVCHGLAGYFETVLYDDVELSTNPNTMASKSRDMISWFPIFFPLKTPLAFPDNTDLDITIWRMTDERKVWYEWLVEAFAVLPTSNINNATSTSISAQPRAPPSSSPDSSSDPSNDTDYPHRHSQHPPRKDSRPAANQPNVSSPTLGYAALRGDRKNRESRGRGEGTGAGAAERTKRVRVGMSELHSSRKNGCLM
ncbi:MAG: hypothetical protein M1819_004474 [Sarea resinae]|nr:MAG: hypothetical protein M1819_004474 [Sarea resinae]